uniref:HAT C-terminal dimerisation domain-containing protein n=1 Tax=Rhizophagus irregularis (strain DAOM 181602 / DAOM 197198 / MUCL 43194) TaxID=747089 RepID=U9UJE1_RHIID
MACEQTFSVAGNTNTKTRNRLNPETARATLCQNHGLKTEWFQTSSETEFNQYKNNIIS